MSVFVFVVEEAFDLVCLPQDYKDGIEISKLIEFCNKRLTESFVFTAKRKLDENFLSFFEEKIRNDVVNQPAKHLQENPSHSFTWHVLSSAQTFHKRRIVEGLMIQQFRPSLNKQVISYVSKLFPSGIT